MARGSCDSPVVQVQEWLKKHLEEKFVPLSDKPESVKQDLENLQREVAPQRPLLDASTLLNLLIADQ